MRPLKPFALAFGLLLLTAAVFALRRETVDSSLVPSVADHASSIGLPLDLQASTGLISSFEDSDDETDPLQPAFKSPERAAQPIAAAPRTCLYPQPVIRAPDLRPATLVGIVLLLV